MRRMWSLAGAVVTLVLGGGVMVWAAVPPPSGAVWIDEPLGWVPISSTPVAVIAHATAPDEVVGARLVVDGTVVSEVEPTDPGATLVVVEFSWEPGEAGLHLLEVVVRNSSGVWGPSGQVVVEVIDRSSVEESTTTSSATSTTVVRSTTTTSTTAPTTTSSSSTTSSTSSTTTTTTCVLGTPTPIQPIGGLPNPTPATLVWGYGGCAPTYFLVELSRDLAFDRIEQSATVGGGERSWTTGPLDCATIFYWRVLAASDIQIGPWSTTPRFVVDCGRTS